MLTFKDEDVRWKLQKQTGTAAVSPVAFHAFSNLEENVRQQIQKVRSHPWVPKQISVRVSFTTFKTGKLKEVAEATPDLRARRVKGKGGHDLSQGQRDDQEMDG